MSYERYHKYGFTYFPPDQAQRELVRKLRGASRPAARTLGTIAENGLIEQAADSDSDSSQHAVGVHVIKNGQPLPIFLVSKQYTTALAFADIGLFRDPNHAARNRMHPKFSQLCREITLLGDQALRTFSLTQPLPYNQARSQPVGAFGNRVLASARIGLVQFYDNCAPDYGGNTQPEAFINIGNEEQVWSIGGNSPRSRTTVTQEIGGIIVRESRGERTSRPNPRFEITATGLGEQLLLNTNYGQEFDRHFPAPRHPASM